MKKRFFDILTIFAFLPTGLFAQATVEELSDESRFEQEHKRSSTEEFVKVTNINSYRDLEALRNGWDIKIQLIGVYLPPWEDIQALIESGDLKEDSSGEIKKLYSNARAAIKNHVSSGDVLNIETDIQEKNSFGNQLIYLISPNRKIINVELVRSGLVLPDFDSDNNRYKAQFVDAYTEAKSRKRGLYKLWQAMRDLGLDAALAAESE